ncbi:MAG: ABC transporter permease [Spirosomataceae bacterium]
MIRNYFKIAWRNLLKNKVFSLINIFGLAIGISVSMLIGLWIFNEFSYDSFHPNRSQLYRVMINGMDSNTGDKFTMTATPLALANTLRNQIPEIKLVAETNWEGKQGLMAGTTKLTKYGTEVAADFFKMFRFTFLQGNPQMALQDPSSIILTAKTAKSLFGNQDPINKTVRWNNVADLKVTAVIEDIPLNSYFKDFEYFMPFSHFENRSSWVKQSRNVWDNFSFQMYVELQPNVSYAQVEPKIRNLIQQHYKDTKSEVAFHPMTKWRLYNEFKNWQATGGNIDYVKMFGLIGFLVLLIACINFMNLSTARSEKRAREVGVRKAVGSLRGNLIAQFLGESMLITSLSFVLALALVTLALPNFNLLLDSQIVIPYTHSIFWVVSLSIIVITGLLAGSYPAFYLSSFSTIRVLKGTFSVGKSGSLPRKILVVVQFAASVVLIISTIVVYQQIKHAQTRPAGYNPNGVILVDMKDDLSKNYIGIKNELLATGIIENVTKASSPIHSIWSNWIVDDFPGKRPNEKVVAAMISTGPHYFKTLQIKLKEGRDFLTDEMGSDSNSIVLNEAAVKRLRLKNPLGQIIRIENARLTIVGIVENTIMSNPYGSVGPAMFLHNPNWANSLMFRIKPNQAADKVIAKITPIFNKYNPAFPFEYQFADAEYGKKFELELRVGKMAGIFALLAVLISCLGLFGLSAYVAEQRTKEIGIRKVLGASVIQLWGMLSRDFVLLVLLSCLIATPIAIYYLNDWLEEYQYRIELSWLVFVMAAIMAVVVTLLTVSYQAIKAALMNPVKSLKTE